MSLTENSEPKHVGIILDGNRRWAKQAGLSSLDGHRKGAEVFKTVALHAFNEGVSYLSAFIFSKENFNRSEEEVSYLMKLVVKAVERYLDEFHRNGIKIVVAGNVNDIPESVLKAIRKTEEKTADNKRGTLILCFNYGGHTEVVDAVNQAIMDGKNRLTITDIEQNLYAPGVPSVDLIIRTSGELRTSGFMMWRAAYAELMFVNKYWPEFTTSDLDKCLLEFNTRQRRFGG